MDTASPRNLADWFPKLTTTPHRITSPYDPRYNCIAWAAGDTDHWWEPDEDEIGFWPPEVSREYSVDAYIRAFESLGFDRCDGFELDPSFEKVAIFANATGPTHAAKQLPDGWWSSKLGVYEDIEHALDAMAGDNCEEYGQVAQVLKRRIERTGRVESLGIPVVAEAALERKVDGNG